MFLVDVSRNRCLIELSSLFKDFFEDLCRVVVKKMFATPMRITSDERCELNEVLFLSLCVCWSISVDWSRVLTSDTTVVNSETRKFENAYESISPRVFFIFSRFRNNLKVIYAKRCTVGFYSPSTVRYGCWYTTHRHAWTKIKNNP